MFNNFLPAVCLCLCVCTIVLTLIQILRKSRYLCVPKIRRKSAPSAGTILIHIEILQKELNTLYCFYGKLCQNPFNLQNPTKNTLFVQNNLKKNYQDFCRIKKELQKTDKKIRLLADKTNAKRYEAKLPLVHLKEITVFLPEQIPHYREWTNFLEKEQSSIFYVYMILQNNLSLLQKSVTII